MPFRTQEQAKRSTALTVALVILSGVQIALYAGCFVLNYAASRRVGAAHHITVTSIQWERDVDMHAIIVIAAAVIVLCAVTLAVNAFRHKGSLREALLLVVCAAAFCVFAFVFSREEVRSYYYLCLILYVAAVLQTVKAVLASREGRLQH